MAETLQQVALEKGALVELDLSPDPLKSSIKVNGAPFGLVTRVEVWLDGKDHIPHVRFEMVPRQVIIRAQASLTVDVPTVPAHVLGVEEKAP